MPRRYDPERRQRIIDAAIRIVELKGIAALSHRAVAAEADVPLGSTTYHFASLDDLLVAALRQVNSEPHSAMTHWEDVLAEVRAPSAGRAGAQEAERRRGSRTRSRGCWRSTRAGTGLSGWSTSCIWPRCAGPRFSPSPRTASTRWRSSSAATRPDAATARVLVALIDGLLLQLLLTDRPFDRAAVRGALARVTGIGELLGRRLRLLEPTPLARGPGRGR